MNATYILNINDKSIDLYLLGIIKNLPNVTIEKVRSKKSKLYKEIEESVNELNEVIAGRKKAQPLDDFLDEL